MSIKTLAFAAATIAATASVASADSYFANNLNNIEASDTLNIGTVSSDGRGVVEIYDYRLGTEGALLGTEPVFSGANSDVRVDVQKRPLGDVLAVLKVDGQIVATDRLDIDRF